MCKKNMSNVHNGNLKTSCPLCGVGEIELPISPAAKRALVLSLHEAGLSVRVIQGILKYKSPRSVHKIIQEHENKTVD